jgi:hypothetical protein
MPEQLTSVPEPRPVWPRIEKLHIVLIKPSKYDDDGYVIRFWKGVLPSNTLNVLHGLTEDVKERRVFGDLTIEVTTFDETAEKIPVKKIIEWSRESGTKLLVGLVGVQTNQFPRALDIARLFRAENIAVIIGGFHASGTINMLGEEEPEIQELVRESICVVSGEVEGKWEIILGDFIDGELSISALLPFPKRAPRPWVISPIRPSERLIPRAAARSRAPSVPSSTCRDARCVNEARKVWRRYCAGTICTTAFLFISSRTTTLPGRNSGAKPSKRSSNCGERASRSRS